ncbi:O-methyltransferase [Caldicellulosiruptoraceae bacterium PP1]
MDLSQDILNSFIRNNLYSINPLLEKMEHYSKINNVPIVAKEVSRLLYILTMLKKPERILEIGTAIGYSTLSMFYGYKNTQIITIERDFDMVIKAKEFFKKANAIDNIHVIGAEAEEALKSIDGNFDLVFIDAAKAQYIEFFNLVKDKLNDNSIIICDNVLYRGMVLGKKYLQRRMVTIAKRMDKFIKMVLEDKQFISTLLPVSDGILISIKASNVEGI